MIIIVLLAIQLHEGLTKDLDLPVKTEHVSPRNIERKPPRNIVQADMSSYDVITTKNLFNPSRSVKETPSPAASGPVSNKELPQLFGTIITNQKKLALLEDRSTHESDLYKVNDSVSGFVLSQIMENKVIFQRDGDSIEVNLREDKKFQQPVRPRTSNKIKSRAQTGHKHPRRVRRRRPRRRRALAGRGSTR